MKAKLYLVNGSLGAGKTTLLSNVLSWPKFKKARIVENEFANVSVDSNRLHKHDREIKTIAGLCICCSSGTELTDALNQLVEESSEPVFIEATGVANSIRLIEKMVVDGVLDSYDLSGAWFVVDAVEIGHGNVARNLSSSMAEIKLADAVLITKTDLVRESVAQQIENLIRKEGAADIFRVVDGGVDKSIVNIKSTIASKLAKLDSIPDPTVDDSSYSVIDTKEMKISRSDFESAWPLLRSKYDLRRAKGDIYEGSNSHHVEATPSHISFSPIGGEELGKLVLIGGEASRILPNRFLSEVQLFGRVNQAVDNLLGMYNQYKTINDEKSKLTSQLAKARLSGEDYSDVAAKLDKRTAKLNKISDDMTFADPMVWMLYKYRAYQDEAQPILNMNDFRIHCSQPGYICTKRFIFTNRQLHNVHRPTMDDRSAYPDDELLDKVVTSDAIVSLAADKSFMDQWKQHEYHMDADRVAKWEDFE